MEAKLFLVCFLGAIFIGNTVNVLHAASNSEALINAICKTTIIAPFCNNFLHSDPRFANADLKGFAQITIEKAKTSATTTASLIGTLEKNTRDPTLKGKLASCSENIKSAISNLNEAASSVVSGDFYDLNNFASSALTDVDTCGDDLAGKEPAQLKQERQKLDNIIRVLLAISNQK